MSDLSEVQSPTTGQSTTSDEYHRQRQAEWEAEESSVAASLPSMFKPVIHHREV